MCTIKRLLVVEDNLPIHNLLISLFEKSGHQVSSSITGSGALDLLNCSNFDLIILDMSLPDMDGKQFMVQLERKNIRTPVIQTSGDEDKFIISDQVKNVLVKPFTLKEIMAAVDQA